MRRILLALLVLTVLLLSVPVSAVDSGPELFVEGPEEAPAVGERFTVVVSIRENPGILSAELTLVYDQALLKCIEVEAGAVLRQTMTAENPSGDRGARMAAASGTIIQRDGVLWSASFTVQKAASRYEIRPDDVLLYDESGQQLQLTVSSLVITGDGDVDETTGGDPEEPNADEHADPPANDPEGPAADDPVETGSDQPEEQPSESREDPAPADPGEREDVDSEGPIDKEPEGSTGGDPVESASDEPVEPSAEKPEDQTGNDYEEPPADDSEEPAADNPEEPPFGDSRGSNSGGVDEADNGLNGAGERDAGGSAGPDYDSSEESGAYTPGQPESDVPERQDSGLPEDAAPNGSDEAGPERVPKTTFPDIAGHWGEQYIIQAAAFGLFNGFEDGSFRPDGTVTRGQYVTVLWRMAGKPMPTSPPPFADVEPDEWYADAVAWAYENGLINGRTETVFDPNGSISRQEAMKILFAYAGGVSGMESLFTSIYDSQFPDSGEIADWARPAMYWAIYHEIVSGSDVGLEPRAYTTRAQLSKILINYMNHHE